MHLLMHYNQEIKCMKDEEPLGWCLSNGHMLLSPVKNIKCANTGGKKLNNHIISDIYFQRH